MAQKMKWLTISVLVILSIIVIMPPLCHHYVYPTSGDDTAMHLLYFQRMDITSALYVGQYLTGSLINALPFDPMVTFLWFHYAVMIIALWVIGLTVALAVNWLAGVLSVLLVFGISHLMPLFQWGQIFDIVGIAILLPMALLCLHKMDKGIGWKIGAIVSLIAFVVFHVNGKFIYALAPMVIFYEVARVIVSRKYEGLGKKMREYRFLYYTGVLSIILWVLYIVKFAPAIDPGRLWLDGSILMAVCISGIVGLYLSGKRALVSLGVILLVVGLAMPNTALWLQNNSAIKNVDKEAIDYLNNLDGHTYTASTQVAQWIYGFYMNKRFQDSIWVSYEEGRVIIQPDYVVVRTIPMTPGSAIGNRFFRNQGRETITRDIEDNGYKLLRVFYEGEEDRVSKDPIIVSVYGK